MEIRELRQAELPEAIAVLDHALLDVDREAVGAATYPGSRCGAFSNGTICGVMFVKNCHIEAIAVRPPYRNRGIGRQLVKTGTAHCEEVTATFEARSVPFYRALGFEWVETPSGIYRGTLQTD